MFEIRSEYNLRVSSQVLDFLVFQNSVLLDREDFLFETGYSFDINGRCSSGDIVNVFQLINNFEVCRYFVNGQGFCSSVDLYGKNFYCDKNNNIVFLNGHLVQPECYTVEDDYIRFYVEGELDKLTNTAHKFVEWQTNDLVTIISSSNISSLKAYRFNGGNRILPSIDLDNKSFQPNRNETVVFLNGKILRSKDLQFGGSVLKLNIETKESDRLNVFVFDKNFNYFEYEAKSGQHIFNSPDVNGNNLRYSSKEGGCLLEIDAQWSDFAGIRKGYYVVATSEIDGEQQLGMAKISETEFTKGFVSAEVIQEFRNVEYDSSQWFLLPPDSKNITSYLDERTYKTKLIPDILDSLQWNFFNDYADGLERVQNSRSISNMDDSFLSKTLNYLGLFLDTSEMSLSNRRKALRELSYFYSRVGTQGSTNYLGFIEDSLMKLTDALWTSDYINFYTKEELGARSYKRELVDFTDYRYVSSEPTAFDDYGSIPVRERSKIVVGIDSLKFIKGSYIINSETKKWERVLKEVEWSLLNTDIEDGEYYLLLLKNNENYFLDVAKQIPTNEYSDNSLYVYSENTNSILRKNIKLDFISLPIGKVFINNGRVYYKQFEAFTHTDNKIFSIPESSFSVWNKKDEIIYPENISVQNTKELKVQGGEYYLVYKYLKDKHNSISGVTLEAVEKHLIHNVGVKPDPSFKTELLVNGESYTYNRFGKNPLTVYNDEDEESIKVDEFGFSELKYDRKDLWFKTTSIGSGEELPAEATIYDKFSVGDKDYLNTGRDKLPNLKYNPEKFRYDLFPSEGKEWVEVERKINCNSTEIMPYLDGECYFNLQDFKWYKFDGESWNESLMAVVGEFNSINNEIIDLIEYTDSASFVDQDYTYSESNDNKEYKRKFNLERNRVYSPTINFIQDNEVAYDWGLITESPTIGWVMYTEFDPPRGYYPTNHVLFNYTANGIEDTQEMLMKAKYKFYEVCPTPWVLQDIANILLFDSSTIWVGNTLSPTFGIFFKEYEKYTRIRFIVPEGYNLKIINNDDDYIYPYQNDGTCGSIEDCSGIISREFFGSNEFISYHTTDKNKIIRTEPSNFNSISNGGEIDLQDFKFIESKVGKELILVLSNNEYEEVYRYVTKNPGVDSNGNSVESVVRLDKIFNKYSFKVNVISENDDKNDKIKVIINGIESDNIQFLMNDDQKFTANISVTQYGCEDYNETLIFSREDFDRNRSLSIDVNLYKKDINISFTSELSAFDLYIRRRMTETEEGDTEYEYGEAYEYDISSHSIVVPYNTNIYYKYSKDLYNDLEGVLVAKDDRVVSASLEKNKYTVSLSVEPEGIKTIINGIISNRISANTGDRIFWSAGNYMYNEAIGEFNLYGDTNIDIKLDLLEDYREEESIPEVPEPFEPITFTENGTWTAPRGIRKVFIDCVAAQGNRGGFGGRVQTILSVIPGRKYYITVGKVPQKPYEPSYNASDIRSIEDNLSSRMVVAGGGGSGCTHIASGGAGGGLVGQQGQSYGWAGGGFGGNQSSGGASGVFFGGGTHGHNSSGESGKFGLGGYGVYCTIDWLAYSGAGGAGWFGGAGGVESHFKNHGRWTSSGGGGSSYADPIMCSETIHTQGYKEGNGYVTISMV